MSKKVGLSIPATPPHPGKALQMLRRRSGLSIRQLGTMAGVTAGFISAVERGVNSPSIATLQQILQALGSDLQTFFGNMEPDPTGPVFPRERMRTIADRERQYTMLLPRSERIPVAMMDEHIHPGRGTPPYETLPHDVVGYLLAGNLVLDIQGQPARRLRAGDSFFVPRGTSHRGYATGRVQTRLVTVYCPPKS